MPNFFEDNESLRRHLERLDLREVVLGLEHDFSEPDAPEDAPESYEEAIALYQAALDLLGQISAERIAPRAAEVDLQGTRFEDGRVQYAPGTVQNIQDLADAGFMGIIIPRRFGGVNFPATIYMMMIELLSRADASLMTQFGYQDVGEAIAKHGTPEQAQEFLTEYAMGRAIGAMVMSEPAAGSDVQAIQLRAYQDEEGNWFLKGVKHFISNGNGEVLLVVARTDSGQSGMFGLSLFACHGGGRVAVRNVEKKMGIHGSPTCELYFDDAPAQLIGRRRNGFQYVMQILEHARFSVAAQALGIAEGAYRAALDYAGVREQFGETIQDLPPVANMLIEMQVSLEWMRAMLYAGSLWLDLRNVLEERIRAERSEDSGHDRKKLSRASRFLALLSPLTKYAVTEAAVRICYDAQQVHGGMGYMREMAIERMVRDVRITTIYEGTSQVQIASCAKGVFADVLGELFDEMEARDHPPEAASIKEVLKEVRETYLRCAQKVASDETAVRKNATQKEVVDMYAGLWTGHLLLDQVADDERTILIALRHANEVAARAAAGERRIDARMYSDVERRALICR